jgi:hypothetical protein
MLSPIRHASVDYLSALARAARMSSFFSTYFFGDQFGTRHSPGHQLLWAKSSIRLAG